jgi:two-component system NtrC family response regulator
VGETAVNLRIVSCPFVVVAYPDKEDWMDIETGAFAGLLGRSPAMERLRRDVAQLGPSELRVHVCGETGTGKENVARALHALSPRARRTFVPVNVAGFNDGLLGSELFGHARGAFTGAVEAREGYIARAEGGTLFIDEVAEMSTLGQVSLLRFLQGGEYQRLGETCSRKADVRVISATNVELAERVREGRFRKDLWYRLKVDRIDLPPLRERGDDVLLLARHFLGREAEHRREAAPGLTHAVERSLLRYAWPGNVRELEGEMQRAALWARGREVTLEDLSPEVKGPGRAPVGGLEAAVQGFERDLVRGALERHRGILAQAAAELGITRQSLWAKVRRLGLVGGGM